MELVESVGTTVEMPVANAVVPEFSGKPNDLMADLNLLAKEQGIETAPPKAEVTQPETTATAPVIAPEVPEKFKAPDGSLDAAKLEKSTVDADAAIAKYLAKEKELRQKMNEVNTLSKQTILPTVAPVAPAPNQVPLSQFEIDVANDLINQAAAYGYQMPQGQAIAQARVQVRLAQANADYETKLTESLRIKLEDQDRRSELEAIAKYDASVLSPEGFEALAKIRDSKPWINQSPKPWTEAYDYLLAERTKAARQQGTVLPTPTGLTAKAPPTPVGPAPRAVVQPTGPNLEAMHPDQITAHVKNMTAEQEAAFWKSRGLRF